MKGSIIIFLLIGIAAKAQDTFIVRGDLNGLKGISSYNVMFNYDSIVIGKGVSENQYLENVKTRCENKMKGLGDVFVNQWYDDRQKRFEPFFKDRFEKQSGISLKNTEAKYTMILKTRHLEGGVDIIIYPIPSLVGGELWIVETANLQNVKAVIRFKDIPGVYDVAGDFEMTNRIRSAYGQAGKWLSIFLLKNRKK